jgi:hypothetical protein
MVAAPLTITLTALIGQHFHLASLLGSFLNIQLIKVSLSPLRRLKSLEPCIGIPSSYSLLFKNIIILRLTVAVLLIYVCLAFVLILIDGSVRAGVFFAGVALAFSQLAINIVLNSISTGMDIAGLWPRFINIRRGAYIMALVCVYSTCIRTIG